MKPGFTWRECGKPHKISATIACLGAKIWTWLLLNMMQYWLPGCHIWYSQSHEGYMINQPIVLQNADMLCTTKLTAWLLLAVNATHKLLADSLICL